MQKHEKEQRANSSRLLAKRLLPLLAVLLLSLLVSGVFAQEGPEAEEGRAITFVEDDNIASPENVAAPAGEIWIRVAADTFIASNDPNRNYGPDSLVRFGFSPSGLGATRPLFRFNVSAIPSGARISNAEFHVYLTNNNDPSRDRGYAAHALHSSWNESFVTWNTAPAFGGELGRGILGNNPGWQVTNVTTLVRNWQSRPNDNHGIILIGDERPDQNFERDYFSKESSSNLYPRLRVQFDTSVDNVAPVATVVQPSAGSWSPADFVVRWEGNDPPNSDGSPGSGIRWYDAYYTTDNGANWRIGRAQVTSTQTNVNGAANGARIGFYVRARDNAGNEGPLPSGSGSIQSWTRIDARPPNVTMNPLPEYTQSTSFQVSWFDNQEAQESGIRNYDVQFRQQGGEWTQLAYGTTATSTTFNRGVDGVTYEFRARGTDNVGNVQPWGDAQASTTVFSQPLAEIVPFVPFIYQKTSGPAAGDSFTVAWRGLTPPGVTIASFDVRYRAPGTSNWTNWLTATTLSSSPFNLGVNDPDGIYTFQARATNSQGVTGPYEEQLQEQIIVDRNAPFITAQSAMPIVFSRIPGAGFTSGQQVQNTGSASSTSVFTAFDLAGQASNCGTKAIAPGASQTYLTDTDCPVPATFIGSAVASADQPIVAIVNVNNRGTGAAAGQYQGTDIAQSATTLYFPLVKNDHSGRTTIFVRPEHRQQPQQHLRGVCCQRRESHLEPQQCAGQYNRGDRPLRRLAARPGRSGQRRQPDHQWHAAAGRLLPGSPDGCCRERKPAGFPRLHGRGGCRDGLLPVVPQRPYQQRSDHRCAGPEYRQQCCERAVHCQRRRADLWPLQCHHSCGQLLYFLRSVPDQPLHSGGHGRLGHDHIQRSGSCRGE